MPRPPSPASRTSLYRLREVTDLLDGVREKYRKNDDFEVTDLRVRGRDALMVRGAMKTPTVSWAGTLHDLTGETIDMGNSTAAAVLLLRPRVNPKYAGEDVDQDDDTGEDVDQDDDTGEDDGEQQEDDEGDVHGAWALAYGMGFQLLEMSKIDSGFGQRIAIRTADPRELSSLTRTTLDQRARTERASIPGGDDLRGFGAGAFGELVTRLVAKADISTLTGGPSPSGSEGPTP